MKTTLDIITQVCKKDTTLCKQIMATAEMVSRYRELMAERSMAAAVVVGVLMVMSVEDKGGLDTVLAVIHPVMPTMAASGASFGRTIIIQPAYSNDVELIKHEYGHTIQSFYLGWLYLVIVGIPSVIHWIACSIKPELFATYYSRYPESCAEKLGKE